MASFAGRPRKNPIALNAGQLAIDGEFQDIPLAEGGQRMPQSTGHDIYPMLDEGENTKYISVIIETHEIAKDADPNNIESLYSCLNRYIEMCRRYDVKLTNMGAYQACGLSRDVVFSWATGQKRKNNPEYARFAQLIRAVCSEYREILMAEGKISPVTGIWWQKNYDRFQDNPAPFLDAADETEELTSAEIAEKYRDIPDD